MAATRKEYTSEGWQAVPDGYTSKGVFAPKPHANWNAEAPFVRLSVSGGLEDTEFRGLAITRTPEVHATADLAWDGDAWDEVHRNPYVTVEFLDEDLRDLPKYRRKK